jgi:hypothetical protein
MLRPAYCIFAGMIVSNLGRGKAARTFFEIAGTLVIIGGIVDMMLHAGSH